MNSAVIDDLNPNLPSISTRGTVHPTQCPFDIALIGQVLSVWKMYSSIEHRTACLHSFCPTHAACRSLVLHRLSCCDCQMIFLGVGIVLLAAFVGADDGSELSASALFDKAMAIR